MFKVNNRSTRCCSGVFIVYFGCIWHIVPVFFCCHWTCKWQMEDLIAFISLMHFWVRSRSLVTFKIKPYITTVNSSFQSLTIFCHKKLHLRCCIGLKFDIVIWSTKILKGIMRHSPHDQVQPWQNVKNSLS